MTRALVVEQARSWIGTRYHHQGRVKGHGVDCAGLIIGVAAELGLADVSIQDYSRYPDGASLLRYCNSYMAAIPVEVALPGDVFVLTFDRHPQHMGFCSSVNGRESIIHSYADARRVVEHEIDKFWRDRVRGAFRIPGVE